MTSSDSPCVSQTGLGHGTGENLVNSLAGSWYQDLGQSRAGLENKHDCLSDPDHTQLGNFGEAVTQETPPVNPAAELQIKDDMMCPNGLVQSAQIVVG